MQPFCVPGLGVNKIVMKLLLEEERDFTHIKQVKIPIRNCYVYLEGISLLGEDKTGGPSLHGR